MNVFGGANDLAQLTERLGEHWEMTKVAYKPYPCGVVLHALIDACLAQREQIRRAGSIVGAAASARRRAHRPARAAQCDRGAAERAARGRRCGAAGGQGWRNSPTPRPSIPELRAFRRRVSVVPDAGLDKMAALVTAGGSDDQRPAPRPWTMPGSRRSCASSPGRGPRNGSGWSARWSPPQGGAALNRPTGGLPPEERQDSVRFYTCRHHEKVV